MKHCILILCQWTYWLIIHFFSFYTRISSIIWALFSSPNPPRYRGHDLSVLSGTCKGPLEAPWPPTSGPIETLHLYPVRLSCLGKVGSAMVTLRASQGQRKWGNRSQQLMKTPTFPDLSVCLRTVPCRLGCSCTSASVQDVILGVFIRG